MIKNKSIIILFLTLFIVNLMADNKTYNDVFKLKLNGPVKHFVEIKYDNDGNIYSINQNYFDKNGFTVLSYKFYSSIFEYPENDMKNYYYQYYKDSIIVYSTYYPQIIDRIYNPNSNDEYKKQILDRYFQKESIIIFDKLHRIIQMREVDPFDAKYDITSYIKYNDKGEIARIIQTGDYSNYVIEYNYDSSSNIIYESKENINSASIIYKAINQYDKNGDVTIIEIDNKRFYRYFFNKDVSKYKVVKKSEESNFVCDSFYRYTDIYHNETKFINFYGDKEEKTERTIEYYK